MNSPVKFLQLVQVTFEGKALRDILIRRAG
jgi:hypothetical protein